MKPRIPRIRPAAPGWAFFGVLAVLAIALIF
jgi:hypothetical protein